MDRELLELHQFTTPWSRYRFIMDLIRNRDAVAVKKVRRSQASGLRFHSFCEDVKKANRNSDVNFLNDICADA